MRREKAFAIKHFGRGEETQGCEMKNMRECLRMKRFNHEKHQNHERESI
jgi:hypothetical protein